MSILNSLGGDTYLQQQYNINMLTIQTPQLQSRFQMSSTTQTIPLCDCQGKGELQSQVLKLSEQVV